MMQAAEPGHRGELTGRGRAPGEPARARGWLVAEAAVGPAVVVAEVLAQDALGMAFAEDHDVVKAVATKRPNQTFANRVRQRRPRLSWRNTRFARGFAVQIVPATAR
jgi:hypothetical protein